MEKLAKRGVPLRGVKYGKVEQSGKYVSQVLSFTQGIESEKAKALAPDRSQKENLLQRITRCQFLDCV